MALTISLTQTPYATVFGNKKVVVLEATFDSSYATSGEALTASDFGLVRVDFAITSIKVAANATDQVSNAYFDPSTELVVLYDDDGAEISSGDDVSSLIIQVVAFGS